MKSKVLRSIVFLYLLVAGIGNAWGATVVGGINYELKSSLGTYWAEVVAINGGYSGNLVIPENISAQDNWGVRRSYKVSVIAAGAFQNCTELTSVVVPNVVDKIEANAFSGCSKLSDVYITWQSLPNNVPASAFLTGEDNDITIHCPYGCSRDSYYDSSWGRKTYLDEASHVTVSSEILSNQVYYVINSSDNKNFFETIIDLVTLGIAPTEGRTQDKVKKNQFGASNVASKNPGTQAGGIGTLTFDGNVTKVGDNAFKDCYGSEKIFIPSTVQSIGNNAFQNCTGLTTLNSTGSGDAGIVIPNNVNSIGQSAFENCVSISSVTITNANTTLAEGAFKKCVSLSSVSLPEGLTAIPAEAFMNCSSLSEITIPSTVKSIGENAFAGTNISKVVIPASVTRIEANAFPATVTEIVFEGVRTAPLDFNPAMLENKATVQSVTLTDNVVLSEGEFVGFTALETVVLPSDLTTIPATTFKNCSNLATCEIPSSVTTIGTEAFAGTKLASVSVPESVTKMGDGAFKGCASLTEVTLPEGMTTIPAETFMNCSSLTEVTIPSTVTTIGKDAFAGTNITKIVIPASVTSIEGTFPASVTEVVFEGVREDNIVFDKSVFADPSKITSVSLATGVKLNEGAFDGFTALEQVTLPGDLTTIYDNMFKGCETLKEVNIPSVETIGVSAFEGCTSLTNVALPDNLEIISATSFKGCSNLETCNIPEKVSYIGVEAFAGTKLTSVTIPASVDEIAAGAFPSTVSSLTFEDRTAEDGQLILAAATTDPVAPGAFTNPNLTAVTVGNGVVLTDAALGSIQVSSVTISNNMRDVTESPLAGLSSLASVTISDAKDSEGNPVVTSIGNNVFNGISTLSSVNFNEGLEEIGDGAFAGTGLTSVDIPNSVSSLGQGAFYQCESLAKAVLPSNLTEIPASLFEGSSSLSVCDIPGAVETIGKDAFKGTALESVTIPASVAAIAAGAFPESVSELTFADRAEGALPLDLSNVAAFAENNASLTSVTMGNGVTLSNATFGGESHITEVVISADLNDVAEGEESPIKGLTSVTTVSFKDDVTIIGASAFEGCSNIANADLNNVETIRKDAFKGTGLANVDLTNVSTVGAGAFAETKLESVSIPSGITLGEGVFAGTTTLASATLAEGMTTIPASTFEGCSALASANIPSTVETIGTEAFAGTGLTSVAIPASVDNIEAGAFSGSLTSVVIADQSDEGGLTIADGAFAGNEGLTTVTIGNGVTLKDATFGGTAEIPAPVNTVIISTNMADVETSPIVGLNSVKTVTISEGIETIGNNVFNGCDDLIAVNIPNTVTSMGTSAFEGCTGLTTVDLSDNMTAISDATFKGCSNLTTCDIPEKVETIGFEAFAGTQLASVNIPTSVDEIKASAFPSTVTSLTFKDQTDGALIIADGAFAGGEDLESVTIGNGVTLTDATFSNNSSISEVVIASNMNNVDASPIVGLDGVEIITISDGVTSIGNNVFKDCEDLTRINFNDDITTIGNNAFAGTGLASVVVPNTVTELGKGTFAGCESLESAVLPTNAGFTEIDAQMFMGCSELATCAIPDNVTTIGAEAFAGTKVNNVNLNNVTSIGASSFANNANLTNVDLANVESIGKNAFKGTALESVDLANVTTVGDGAFAGTKLEEVSIPSGTTLGEGVFAGTTTLASATLAEGMTTIPASTFNGCSALTSANIPTTVETIGDNAFAGTGLTEVSVPGSVATIGAGAFSGAKNLTSVTIAEGVQSIGKDAFAGTDLTTMTIAGTEPKVGTVVLPASVTEIGEDAIPASDAINEIALNSIPVVADNLPSGKVSIELTDASKVAKDATISGLKSLNYKRLISSDWGTLMLPFDIQSTENEFQLYELREADFENNVLSFELKDEIKGNTPCVFKKITSENELTFNGGQSVTVGTSQDVTLSQDQSEWTLKGTYEKINLRTIDNDINKPDTAAPDVYFIANNKFNKATQEATVTVNAYRAWFESVGASSASLARTFTIEIYDSSTGVKTVLNEEESAAFIYDLTGVKQSSVKSGKINIVNGKKSIVK